MKIPNVPGEYAFRALTKYHTGDSWGLTASYFFSLKEVEAYYDPKVWGIKWPVEVNENGSIYVPSPEEIK